MSAPRFTCDRSDAECAGYCRCVNSSRIVERIELDELDDKTRALDEGRHDRAAHRKEVENDA